MESFLQSAFYKAAEPAGKAFEPPHDPYWVEYTLQYALNLSALKSETLRIGAAQEQNSAQILPFSRQNR